MAIPREIKDALNAANEAVEIAQKNYLSALESYNKYLGISNELNRQYKYHESMQNWVEMQNISPSVVTAQQNTDIAKGVLDQKTEQLAKAKKLQSSAKSDYDEAMAEEKELEKEKILASTNPAAYADLLAQKAKAAASEAVEKTKAAAATAMQGTTKYLIIGAIVLVIITVAVFLFRKKLAA